jgi:hypothetical protein
VHSDRLHHVTRKRGQTEARRCLSGSRYPPRTPPQAALHSHGAANHSRAGIGIIAQQGNRRRVKRSRKHLCLEADINHKRLPGQRQLPRAADDVRVEGPRPLARNLQGAFPSIVSIGISAPSPPTFPSPRGTERNDSTGIGYLSALFRAVASIRRPQPQAGLVPAEVHLGCRRGGIHSARIRSRLPTMFTRLPP